MARENLVRFYNDLLRPGQRIVDLMAGWESHLPAIYDRVHGIGLNPREMAENPALEAHTVQDLNRDPRLDMETGAVDAVVCSLSIEYLTDPAAVFREVGRILRPGGRFIVVFSNRWFPEKAIRIEENGAAFYRKAAGLQQGGGDDKKFLEKLAQMEDRHQAVFEVMRKEVADAQKASTVFDPDEELSLYLAAMADSHGGEGSPDVADFFTGRETISDIITMAIGLEKESILFYVGLKDLVPPKLGQDKIDVIIKEEQMHVAQLKGFLKKASA